MTIHDFMNSGRSRSRRRRSPAGAGLALAFGAGAAAAALLQPRSGARRRSLIVQKTLHAGRTVEDFGEKSARDLANRSRGLLAIARSTFRGDHPSPEVLSERVRAKLGRLTAHAGAIQVSAREGTVELRGPVLRAEADQVVDGVRKVRGVHDVVDLLERHAEPGQVPGLQGGARRPRPLPEPLQQNWSPGMRLVAIACGSALVAAGLRARGAAIPLGAAGALIALRGLTNRPMKSLLERGRADGVTRDEVAPHRPRA